jgi:hypothetical protein
MHACCSYYKLLVCRHIMPAQQDQLFSRCPLHCTCSVVSAAARYLYVAAQYLSQYLLLAATELSRMQRMMRWQRTT